jgi:hypothetical protein
MAERPEENPLANLKKMYLFGFATIVAYVACGYFLRNTTVPKWLSYITFAFLLYDAIFFPYRFRELRRLKRSLRENLHDTKTMARFQLCTMLLFGVAVTLGMAGWILQVSHRLWLAGEFYAAAISLLLIFFPREPKSI